MRCPAEHGWRGTDWGDLGDWPWRSHRGGGHGAHGGMMLPMLLGAWLVFMLGVIVGTKRAMVIQRLGGMGTGMSSRRGPWMGGPYGHGKQWMEYGPEMPSPPKPRKRDEGTREGGGAGLGEQAADEYER